MSVGFKALLKDYFLNSSFAGLKYIAEDGRHWTERWKIMKILTKKYIMMNLIIVLDYFG